MKIILQKPNIRIERIVSTGQSSPPGFWYDQEEGEFVVLITGRAGLWIEGETEPRVLEAGSCVDLPPHCRHRVEWTSEREPTIWLAVFYQSQAERSGKEDAFL